MTEARIDARAAQGLVNRPEGAVNQQFGDRATANVDGGDAAGRDIDKSTVNNYFILPGAGAASSAVRLLICQHSPLS